MKHHPVPDAVLVATASDGVVDVTRLPEVLSVVKADLALRIDEYRERNECAYEDDSLVAFSVEPDHWRAIADRLGFESGAVNATRDAHARLLLGLGEGVGRRDEYASALDVQDCVVIDKAA